MAHALSRVHYSSSCDQTERKANKAELGKWLPVLKFNAQNVPHCVDFFFVL